MEKKFLWARSKEFLYIYSFNLDDTCEDLKNTESVNFTCVDFVDDLYKSCTPECKDPDFVFLNAVPRKINCGPLGVFDPYNPTSTFQISECGSKKYINNNMYNLRV